MKIKSTPGEKLFDLCNVIVMLLIVLITLYPFYFVIISSFSDGYDIILGNVLFYPVGFNLNGYRGLAELKNFVSGYGNTIFYAVIGTLTSLVVMTMGAYALSRERFKYRTQIGFFISFTLWFKAGIVPIYLNFQSLDLLDTRLGIVIGFAVNVFYIVVMRSFFEGIPNELEEAARVDGLSNFGIFFKIMLPLAKPMLATIGLYCVVDRWNAYFWSMLLVTSSSKMPLQVILKALILDTRTSAAMSMGANQSSSQDTMIYSVIVVSILPMLIAYPFAQRFFEKGLTVGAVKG
ncbi:MAG: carbohydrate ABC transporter permease [Clostridia bacterium]